MMQNILKKSLSCCLLFCSVLLCCTACGTEPESPDTLEDILNPNRNEQETETETDFSWFSPETEESTTEYQNILFPETDVPTERPVTTEYTPVISEMPVESATEYEPPEFLETSYSETETLPLVTTAPVMETFPVYTQPVTEVPTEISAALPWEDAYYEFLLRKEFQRQISTDVQETDTKFLLLCLNEDNIPELFIQTTMEVLIYSYHQNRVVFVDSFYPSHYTYDFYYRPYHNTLGTLQGSVMGDGTYLEIYEFQNTDMADSGLALQTSYCYPTRDYSYEIYTERGMNIDLEKAPDFDVHPDREKNLGASWITVPDVLENSSSVQRYEISEDSLNALFGSKETAAAETITETREGRYAFR